MCEFGQLRTLVDATGCWAGHRPDALYGPIDGRQAGVWGKTDTNPSRKAGKWAGILQFEPFAFIQRALQQEREVRRRLRASP